MGLRCKIVNHARVARFGEENRRWAYTDRHDAHFPRRQEAVHRLSTHTSSRHTRRDLEDCSLCKHIRRSKNGIQTYLRANTAILLRPKSAAPQASKRPRCPPRHEHQLGGKVMDQPPPCLTSVPREVTISGNRSPRLLCNA